MVEDTKAENQSGVDKGLVRWFLRMSPDDRLRANDNAMRTILELRHAYRQRKTEERKPKRNSTENRKT